MRKYTTYLKTILLLLITWGMQSAKAQTLMYVEDIQFVTESGALVFVGGTFTYKSTSTPTITHQGQLIVIGDWENMSSSEKLVFNPSAGWVLMDGDLQTFQGINTRFPNLRISGTNIKQQYTNIEVTDTLDLTDRELDVNGNTMYVLSDKVDAILYNNGGYVNTANSTQGWLNRTMKGDSSYIYPLGSNNGTFRFRPIKIKPQVDGRVNAQFQHNDPSIDGYWVNQLDIDALSEVNSEYYHGLKADLGKNNLVDVQIYPYNHLYDGVYTTMVQWNFQKKYWEKLVSTGPFKSYFPTNDSAFSTKNLALLNGETKIINLGNEHHAKFHIPNVITPNYDGINDQFVISHLEDYPENEIVIFNRWNNNVYQKKNYANDWDGSGLNDGTYFYVLKVKDIKNVWHEYKGFIMILR